MSENDSLKNDVLEPDTRRVSSEPFSPEELDFFNEDRERRKSVDSGLDTICCQEIGRSSFCNKIHDAAGSGD